MLTPTLYVSARPPLLDPCSEDAVCVAKYGQHAACREYWCACVDGADFDSGFSKRCLLSRLGSNLFLNRSGHTLWLYWWIFIVVGFLQ